MGSFHGILTGFPRSDLPSFVYFPTLWRGLIGVALARLFGAVGGGSGDILLFNLLAPPKRKKVIIAVSFPP